jgi:hypothetical protein
MRIFSPWRAALLAGVAVLACPRMARAQVRPFFGGGVSAFTPEIDVVNTGVLNNMQATVSADRKYVTINARPSNSQLLALREFRIAGPQFAGFIGGIQFNGVNGKVGGAFGEVNPPAVLSAGRGAEILQQRGMTRIVLAP